MECRDRARRVRRDWAAPCPGRHPLPRRRLGHPSPTATCRRIVGVNTLAGITTALASGSRPSVTRPFRPTLRLPAWRSASSGTSRRRHKRHTDRPGLGQRRGPRHRVVSAAGPIRRDLSSDPGPSSVAVASSPTSLVAGDSNGVADIVRRDLQSASTMIVSITPGDTQSIGHSAAKSHSIRSRATWRRAIPSPSAHLRPGSSNDILHTRSGVQLARFLYTLDPVGNGHERGQWEQ